MQSSTNDPGLCKKNTDIASFGRSIDPPISWCKCVFGMNPKNTWSRFSIPDNTWLSNCSAPISNILYIFINRQPSSTHKISRIRLWLICQKYRLLLIKVSGKLIVIIIVVIIIRSVKSILLLHKGFEHQKVNKKASKKHSKKWITFLSSSKKEITFLSYSKKETHFKNYSKK